MLHILIYTLTHRTAAILQGILETINADIDTTTNAATIAHMCESRSYDYIISDDAAYFIDHKEVIRTLRHSCLSTPHIYIIDSQESPMNVCRLLLNGIDQYIAQPLHPRRLLNKIEAL